MAKFIYAGANTDEQFRTELLLSFREPQIYSFSGKFAKTSAGSPVTLGIQKKVLPLHPRKGSFRSLVELQSPLYHSLHQLVDRHGRCRHRPGAGRHQCPFLRTEFAPDSAHREPPGAVYHSYEPGISIRTSHQPSRFPLRRAMNPFSFRESMMRLTVLSDFPILAAISVCFALGFALRSRNTAVPPK